MLLLYLLLYQAKELRNAVPEGHVAGLGGYVNYRGNTVIVVVMVMAGYPRYIRRRRRGRLFPNKQIDSTSSRSISRPIWIAYSTRPIIGSSYTFCPFIIFIFANITI